MALIMNTSSKEQTIKLFGNWFSLKAGQIKNFEDKLAHAMVTDRRDFGLVSLPEEFSDPSFATTEEGKKIMAEKKSEGVNNRVAHLKKLIHNEEISLKKDLDMSNMKMDPKVFANDAVIAHYHELISYQKAQEDEGLKRSKEIEELQKKLKGI